MKTFLLPVPTKKTEEVNWLKPLNNYLLSIYGTTSEYQEDLTAFNKLRSDLRGAAATKTGIKLYSKYYSQIELIDLRIPFATVNKHKKINFEWHDVFQQGITHKQHALPFEKANVLFNLGSIFSRYAQSKYDESQKSSSGASSTSQDELISEAIKALQQAAGVFQFIHENFLHAPSYDLSQSTIKFLVKLMLAQSQEIFVMKVISGDFEQKKNSLIAKLCRSASLHYEECYKVTNHIEDGIPGGVSGTFTGDEEDNEDDDNTDIWQPTITEVPVDNENHVDAQLDDSWIAIIQFKLLYYKSLAYYFNGLNFEATRKYGQALAYLTKSSEIIDEIKPSVLKTIGKKVGGRDAYELLDNYKYQKDAVSIKLNDLNKDNDLIYHDIVPSLVTLPDIKAMDSTKVIPMNAIDVFQEVNEYNYSHFLNNVVPINIHELLSFYSEEKSQFLRNELDMVDVSNEELASALEYLKLPKALVTLKELIGGEDFEPDATGIDDIDPQIKSIADEIASKYASDTSNRDVIAQTKKQIYDNITESEGILARSGGGAASDQLAKYKDDVIKVKKALYDAMNSDNRLFGLVNESNGQLYAALGKGSRSSEFKQLFEVGGTKDATNKIVEEISLLDIDDSQTSKPKGGIIGKQIKRVEDILHDLNVIKSNKAKLIDALKKEIHGDDISDILILNSRVKSTSEIKSVIFPEEMKKFEAYNVELDKLIDKQKTFMGDLKSEWEQLSRNSEVKEIQTSRKYRDQIVRDQSEKIVDFHQSAWQQYTTGLVRGVDFYRQLLGYSGNVKQKISEESRRETQRPGPGFYEYGQVGASPNHTGNSNYPGGNAPALPPKRGSQGSIQSSTYGQGHPGPHGPNGQFQGQNQQFQGQQVAYQNPGNLSGQNQFQGGQLPPQSRTGSASAPSQNQPGSDLIYNNPSTYQPNMYNFFSPS